MISVIIPAHNAAEYLAITLRSILDQTYRDLEVIVVDDGSTDNTAAVIEAHAADDDRVKPVLLESNRGRSAARNIALDAARGEWVCPCDADDLWAADRLGNFVRAAHEFPKAVSFTDDVMSFDVRPDGTVALGHRYASRATWRMGATHVLDLDRWFVDRECHMRTFVRRDLLERHQIRYPEHLSAGEDLAFCIQIAFAKGALPPVRVGNASYYYRSGHSTRAASMAESRVRMTEYAIANTGSERLARLVEQTNPGWIFNYRRADQLGIQRGSDAERDAGSDEVELVLDPVAGYRLLVRNRVVEQLGRHADQRLRAGIVADIERQLNP